MVHFDRFRTQMLMTERYLTVSEVARLLKYYEEKTGMKDWYKNTEDALE